MNDWRDELIAPDDLRFQGAQFPPAWALGLVPDPSVPPPLIRKKT